MGPDDKKVLIGRAREALRALSATERTNLFREFGQCSCASVLQLVAEHPRAGLGAAIGAVAGALFGLVTAPAPACRCSAAVRALGLREPGCPAPVEPGHESPSGEKSIPDAV